MQIKFVTGLLVIVPIAVTVWTFWELFIFVDGLLAPVVADRLGRHVPGVGLLVAILLVLLMGVFATNVVGRRTLGWLDGLLYRIPIFRNVYSAMKQLLNAFSPDNQVAFKEFVLVPNREKGSYSFGFLTGEVALQRGSGETEPLVAVYVPTNHLYLGDIVLVRREDIIQTRLTIPQGIQIVLSGGISIPQILRQKPPDPDRR
ncbi:MAG: hypothetical protein A3G35_04230 [candidate division NC10 bacterium RIFCSPLOWO2_12_FULL_66_18]|nr:MAG: hypothetical protein A3H39_17855 [candidate division NC10 bacterium RIFCSPLOWO2_02_FULL_66_22]OGC01025.1 MAG: hypothetical protein A3G35_04230 [candidate division NC10 bacterium RIFCSPLOWO2_12_FULL_66_18]